ncbi:MAG TPA: dihydroneopterin aldolase [Bacteroidia bacterium]|jgi:dihydroneopterin aldolase|nr:dihydroneopterin aldolase [Bacteroidia bacterium]
MHQIILEGINVYAYHGCLEEEGKIGAEYIVNITMHTDFTEAAQTDDLNKTIDYVTVYNITKQEMGIRSKLIEHPAQRIVSRLKKEFVTLQKVEVKVTKINPPMNGHVDKVSVVITE